VPCACPPRACGNANGEIASKLLIELHFTFELSFSRMFTGEELGFGEESRDYSGSSTPPPEARTVSRAGGRAASWERRWPPRRPFTTIAGAECAG
jgi:hypothetical protein